ncbi:MAG: EamA-like transporter family protein [Rhodobacterales bacterium]|nr:EamA-like transporter family protein [Rhodobacterales bacterium]NCT12877.1 EamA-like transporter family protein [Rhodobacterales bacterium]
MTLMVTLAFAAGLLVSLSRQINGRLALSTSPLAASFWNHLVGLVVLVAAGLAVGELVPAGLRAAPWHAWIGGPIGVLFVAAGSWLIARIGAVNTALLVIAGQMVSGVVLDLTRGAPGDITMRAAGVALIIAGMALTLRRAG